MEAAGDSKFQGALNLGEVRKMGANTGSHYRAPSSLSYDRVFSPVAKTESGTSFRKNVPAPAKFQNDTCIGYG